LTNGQNCGIIKKEVRKIKDKYKPLFEKVIRGNPIPLEWMWNKGIKTRNPFEKALDDINHNNLSEIPCPYCGNKSLRIKETDLYWDTREYFVGCDDCGWDTPGIPRNTDYGEVISEFTNWLAVFNMLGRKKEYLQTDLTLFYYIAGAERNKHIEECIKEEEHKLDEGNNEW
jgi:hypothetical protein